MFKTWKEHNEGAKIFCGLMKPKWNYLEGACSTTSGTAYHENITPTIKYGGGNILIWAWPAWDHQKQFFKSISACQLKCYRSWVRQQDSDTKCQYKSTRVASENQNTIFGLAESKPRVQPCKEAMEHSRRAVEIKHSKNMTAKAVLPRILCWKPSWTMYRSYPQLQEVCFWQLSIPKFYILSQHGS